MSSYPSIFNDVIGPVTWGSSISHCVASLHIALIGRDLTGEDIKDILLEFDPQDSLATTHKYKYSDMDLFGGFLSWKAYDECLLWSEKYLSEADIKNEIHINELLEKQLNTYLVTLKSDKETKRLTAISSGGRMMKLVNIDGNKIFITGYYFETLTYYNKSASIKLFLDHNVEYEEIILHNGEYPCVYLKNY